MLRLGYLIGGSLSFGLGAIGLVLPLLPTTPFMLLAAFCFARSNPAWERRLLESRRFGPALQAWRAHGAVGRPAKIAATLLFATSIAIGLATLPFPWWLLPILAALLCLTWLWTRPEA